MAKYELEDVIDQYTDEVTGQVLRRNNDDGTISYIPQVEGNSDYQRYLRWLENPDAEEGGTL